MDQVYKKKLERNIFFYYFFRIFNKRAYLPLIAVYAVSVANLNLAQFGIIASLSAVVSLILEIPSGYISDRIGHKRAIIFGQLIMTIAPLGYVFFPNFYGILIGSAGYFGGYSFLSGTCEAFMHETLGSLGREGEYSKVVGRMQAVGLAGNVVIVALVPLTYVIDHRLPFIIGSALISINFVISFFLTSPRRIEEKVAEIEVLSFRRLVGSVWSTYAPILFLTLGIASAASDKILEFKEIYFQSLGVSVSSLGLIAAGISLFGAVASYNIHHLEKKLSAKEYYVIHFIFVFIITILAGLANALWLGIICVALLGAYNRSEETLSRSYLLRDCPTKDLKATYISMLAFMEALCAIWIPILLGYLATVYGIRHGYMYLGGILLAVSGLIYSLYNFLQKNSAKLAK